MAEDNIKIGELELGKAKTVNNYSQCAEISDKIRKVFKEKNDYSKQLAVLQKNESKSVWYHKNSGGARFRNLGGHLRGNTHFGGGGKIEFHEISLPLVAKIFNPWIFSIHVFRNFFPDISNFFQTFKNCPGLPKFFTDLPNISHTYQKCNFFSNIS